MNLYLQYTTEALQYYHKMIDILGSLDNECQMSSFESLNDTITSRLRHNLKELRKHPRYWGKWTRRYNCLCKEIFIDINNREDIIEDGIKKAKEDYDKEDHCKVIKGFAEYR